MYTCACGNVLGSSVGDFLGFILGVNIGWEENNPVVLAPGGSPVTSWGNYDGVRGR